MSPFNILRTVADADAHTQLFQAIGDGRRFKVGTRHFVTQRQ